MNKILIIGNGLIIGGAEKLLYELVTFAKENNIKATVLILENYQKEHYDEVLKKIHVNVVRTRIRNIKHLRSPKKMLRSFFWVIKLRFFAELIYDSLHVIGLYNVDKVITQVNHKHRYFWNVNNSVQHSDERYPYPQSIFNNESDGIICINNYQIDEIYGQYGKSNVKTKLILFKLFIRSHDTD